MTEAIGTVVLVFVVLHVGQPPDGMGPLLTGCLMTALVRSLDGPTGTALNLAHDLRPRLAHARLPIRARARATGRTRGCRSSGASSAGSLPHVRARATAPAPSAKIGP